MGGMFMGMIMLVMIILLMMMKVVMIIDLIQLFSSIVDVYRFLNILVIVISVYFRIIMRCLVHYYGN